ncbi:class II fructose-bisphosphate aldolase [Anaerosinus massiliensis]|uniref:class II fructose-bisphosphate aldolase n=1 Tax=Massilibacillus massiliensis TaxID=1806837 RepID=UPI000B3404E0|nr:class II fructose-bisphosphate aldolase [Massilibacillus massiliensis]
MPIVKLEKLLLGIKDNSYAIGSFNVSNMEMVMGTIKAAEELNAPVIIQIAEGRLKYSPLHTLGPMMVAAAKEAKVPVAVHLDHGGTIETIHQALEIGFTSVMFDGSQYPLDINIEKTKQVKNLADRYDANVEAEIGRVGGAEGDYESVDIMITSVDEAVKFYEATKVDALAVAIGTAHGNYKEAPKLRIDRLKELTKAVACPLVLHGGTGLTEQDFKNSLQNGIKKINIATASYDSVARDVKQLAREKPEFNYFDHTDTVMMATYGNVKKHMLIFGLKDKA